VLLDQALDEGGLLQRLPTPALISRQRQQQPGCHITAHDLDPDRVLLTATQGLDAQVTVEKCQPPLVFGCQNRLLLAKRAYRGDKPVQHRGIGHPASCQWHFQLMKLDLDEVSPQCFHEDSLEIKGRRAYRLLIGDREYSVRIPSVSSDLCVYRRLIAFGQLSLPIQPVFSGFRPYRRLIVFHEY